MAMTVSLVGLNVVYNYCYNYFYDVLQSYGQQGVVRLLMVFIVLAGFYLLIAIYHFCTARFFGPCWRRWLTAQCAGRLLQKHGYCAQEEIGPLVNFSIDLSMGLIGIITTFLMFMYYLWLFSDSLESKLGKWSTPWVSEYVVWVGVIYACVGIFFTLKLGRPLISSSHPYTRYQAGPPWYTQLLVWLRTGYNQMLAILPLLMVFPHYFEILFLAGWFLQSLQLLIGCKVLFPPLLTPILCFQRNTVEKKAVPANGLQ